MCSCVQSKKGDKDQESIQWSTTPDPGYHMGKWQKQKLNITNESQGVNLFPAGDHKAASMKDTSHK